MWKSLLEMWILLSAVKYHLLKSNYQALNHIPNTKWIFWHSKWIFWHSLVNAREFICPHHIIQLQMIAAKHQRCNIQLSLRPRILIWVNTQISLGSATLNRSGPFIVKEFREVWLCLGLHYNALWFPNPTLEIRLLAKNVSRTKPQKGHKPKQVRHAYAQWSQGGYKAIKPWTGMWPKSTAPSIPDLSFRSRKRGCLRQRLAKLKRRRTIRWVFLESIFKAVLSFW